MRERGQHPLLGQLLLQLRGGLLARTWPQSTTASSHRQSAQPEPESQRGHQHQRAVSYLAPKRRRSDNAAPTAGRQPPLPDPPPPPNTPPPPHQPNVLRGIAMGGKQGDLHPVDRTGSSSTTTTCSLVSQPLTATVRALPTATAASSSSEKRQQRQRQQRHRPQQPRRRPRRSGCTACSSAQSNARSGPPIFSRQSQYDAFESPSISPRRIARRDRKSQWESRTRRLPPPVLYYA